MSIMLTRQPAGGAIGTETGHAVTPLAGNRLVRAVVLSALAMLAACGPRGGQPTDLILPGGIPANTNLQDASTLPPAATRSIARKDAGWRVIYHPAQASIGADQQVASALCRLERKRPLEILVLPMQAPEEDPGARMIDIICGP